MKRSIVAFLALAFLLGASSAYAADGPLPDLSLSIGGSQLATNGGVSSTLKIVFLLTLLSFAPAMVLTMTCFTRITVVLGMTRTALGVQSMPPNMVITGLSLFLTVAIMSPVFEKMYADGINPYLEGKMDDREALVK